MSQPSVATIAEVPLTEPAYLWVPDRVGSYGDVIIDFWHQVQDQRLDPEHELAIDAAASHDRQGRWVASDVVIIAPRQNGKSRSIVVPMTMADLFLWPPGLQIHTSHRFKTSSETFTVIRTIIESSSMLSSRIKKISVGKGDEFIELINGARLLVLARSEAAGRGFAGTKRLDYDEAFALTTSQMGASLPTQLARNDTQTVYASSAGLGSSDVLRELRDTGRRGGDDDLVYIEWCGAGGWDVNECARAERCNHHWTTPGCVLDDETRWADANFAYPRKRIARTKLVKMRKRLSPNEFGREIVGWWDLPATAEIVPISAEAWEACKDETAASAAIGPVVVAFDISPDQSTGSIAIASWLDPDLVDVDQVGPDGEPVAEQDPELIVAESEDRLVPKGKIIYSELVAYDHGTDWMIDALVELCGGLDDDGEWVEGSHDVARMLVGKHKIPAIICDPIGPAAALLGDLKARRIEPYLMTGRQMAAACGSLQRAVTKGPTSFRHMGQSPVDLAVAGAVRRDIGDGGWGFGRSKSAAQAVDISTLVVITVSRWGLSVAAPPVQLPRSARG